MDINKNVQYSIVRKMLILTVLGVFLISQNIAGIIYENKPSITVHGISNMQKISISNYNICKISQIH